ncbi:MAG TPA: hypothetical protein VLJ21_01890 [Candidatus Binatia bacterium]|nr:hypothetical protein [Candidatus Binatia bacterium]
MRKYRSEPPDTSYNGLEQKLPGWTLFMRITPDDERDPLRLGPLEVVAWMQQSNIACTVLENGAFKEVYVPRSEAEDIRKHYARIRHIRDHNSKYTSTREPEPPYSCKWKPFLNIDPSATETRLETCIEKLHAFFLGKGLKDGADYERRQLHGNVQEFYVRAELCEQLRQEYLEEERGGEYVARQNYQPTPTSRRIKDSIPVQTHASMNRGKRDKHKNK